VEDNTTTTIKINYDASGVAKGTGQATKHLRAFEQDVRQHLNRVREMNARHNNTLETIEKRKEAQLQVIRERAYQQQMAQYRRIEAQARTTSSGMATSFKTAGLVIAAAAVAGLAKFGKEALDAFKEYDKLVNSLRKSEGSIEGARKKFDELFRVGQSNVGTTGSGLVGSFAFLRNSLQGSAKATEALAVAMGKVKALYNDFDPTRAAGNIRQLVSEKFQISDIREMENQAPGFTQGLLSEFGVKNVEALRRKLAELNPTMSEVEERFAKVFTTLGAQTDTFGTKWEKVTDAAQRAIVPFGEFLGRVGMRLIDQFTPAVSALFDRLSAFFGEPPRESRRQISLSQAAAADSSSW
jgi:hypothetical protein